MAYFHLIGHTMTKLPVSRYSIRLNFLVLLLLFSTIEGVWAKTTIVQSFQLRDGRKLYGVLVRSFEDRILVAVPYDVIEIRQREIMISGGGMLTEAAKVHEVLSLIEDAIETGRFERAQMKLESLHTVVQKFSTMAQPFIESSMDTPHQRQECLKQAIGYFERKEKVLPASIASLEISEKIKTLKRSFTNHESRCTETMLSDLISSRNNMEEFNDLIPMAERKRKEAFTSIQELFSRCYDLIQEEAIERFTKTGETEKLLDLFKLLKRGEGLRSSIYAKKMLALVNECLNLCSEVRSKLSSSMDETFKKLDIPEESQPDSLKIAANLHSLTQLFTEADKLLLDNVRQEYQSRIASALKSNENVLESRLKNKDLSIEIRSELLQADLLFEKDQYKDAFEQYGRIEKMLSNSNLPGGEIHAKTEEGLIKSQGMYLLSELRNPETKSRNEIKQLILKTEEYLQTNSNRLSTLNISPATLEKEIRRLTSYKKFLARYDDLLHNIDSRPLEQWNRTIIMSKWLKSLGSAIHKSAFRTWENFLEKNENELYQGATYKFFTVYSNLGEPEFKMIKSFVQYCLRGENPSEAFEVLRKSLPLIRNEAKDDLEKEIRVLVSTIANQFTRMGNQEKIKLMYDLVREFVPEITDDSSSYGDIRLQMIQLAEWHLENNKPEEALETYESIASDYPEYAANNKIPEKILDIYFETNGRPEHGSENELALIEKICEEYPQMGQHIPIVQARSQEIIENFIQMWEEGNFSNAVDAYLTFQLSYPHFSKETEAINQTLKQIKAQIYLAYQSYKESKKSVKNSLINALEIIVQKFPLISHENKLDVLLVEIKLQRANKFLKTGQVRSAFEIFTGILATYPDIGQDKRLYQTMEQLQWKYKIETILSPLGITRIKDWIAFAMILFFFPIILFKTISAGKKRGHLKYRLIHFGTVSSIFLILLCGFIYGKYAFFKASILAFAIPSICFQFIGSSTYLFFPLIYCERLLGIEKKILNVFQNSFMKRFLFDNAIVKYLKRDIERRENDLPVLHDRMLYKIEKAIDVSSAKPEKGYELFSKLLTRLDKEILRPKIWKRHYGTCLYNMGAIANHLDRRDEAINYLHRHLEYDPKSIDARNLLSEIFFENKDFEGAIPHLKVCLAAYGDSDTLWLRLGRCFFETGNYTSAYKCFSSIRKKNRDSLFLQARSYAKANELNNAVESYQLLLKNYPNDSEAIYYLASTFAQFNNDDKAAKIITLISNNNPFYPRTRVLLGNIFYRSKRVKEANEMFINALKIDPSCIQAMIGLGQIACGVNKKDQALELFEKALQVDVNDPAANYFCGVLSETTDQLKSLSYYAIATKSPDFKRLAERRIGLIYFLKNEFSKAVKHFGVAVKGGEDSIWFLYLYAFSLASINKVTQCQEILLKIAREGQSDSLWKSKAGNAMYSLGLNLFDKKDFNSALKCFQFVKSKSLSSDQLHFIDPLFAESKFRMVVQLLSKERLEKAKLTLDELINERKDEEQKNVYTYYLGLCFIYQKNYKDAKQILSPLWDNDRNNPRYLYHLVVAELGQGNDQQAAKLLITLRKHLNLPDHLRVGLQMIRAYLLAKQGKMRNAEASLADIPELAKDFPGVEYMHQKALMSRMFYLCHARDSRKIQSIIDQLTGNQKAKAILMHAIAAIESGQLKVGKDILKPFVEETTGHRKLFTTVCTELAVKAMSNKDYKQALTILEEIPDRSEAIESVSVLLSMAELLQNIENFESITQAIVQLTDYLSKVENRKLRHSIIHNLGILQLKRVIMAEENGDQSLLDDLWLTCWQFWMEKIFKSQEYWNFEQEKFSGAGKPLKSFTQKEVEVIYKKFIDEHFADMFLSYIQNYLIEADEKGVARHLNLLQTIANETGNSKNYYTKLQEQLIDFRKSINKTDERYSTWDFYILTLNIQCSISEILNVNNADELNRKLDNFQEFRKKFQTPADYKKAQKQFNSNLLEALHLGIEKKFSEAGNRLQKVLKGEVPGVLVEETIEKLLIVRENCRRVSKANSVGSEELKKSFEDLYSTITGKKSTLDPDIAPL